jgi:hypothetical protein
MAGAALKVEQAIIVTYALAGGMRGAWYTGRQVGGAFGGRRA